jgi:RimJ/RimL family protein N-acetyltransferase
VPDLRLEPLTDAHRDDLDALLHDPLVLRFTRYPDPLPPDFVSVVLGRYRDDDSREGFVARDAEGAFVGVCMVVGLDREAEECELGYMVAPAARGRGVATEMLRLLTRHAFEDLRLQRVTLHIGADNAASERVAERNGYTREGLLRNAYVKPGVRGDTSIWSKLATDPVS